MSRGTACLSRRGLIGMHTAGFTLVELMVTVAVAAILMAIAFPNMVGLINGQRLTSQANELVVALQSARMDAIRFNRRVIVCKSTNGTSCDTAGGAWSRWVTYVDTDGNGLLTNANEVLRTGTIRDQVSLLASPAISGNSQRIVYGADGLARDGAGSLLRGALSVCKATSQPTENIRLVQLVSGSRVAVTAADGGASCATPANPA